MCHCSHFAEYNATTHHIAATYKFVGLTLTLEN